MPQSLNDRITNWIGRQSGFWFAFYASASAFCLYTCIFALRKAFGAATYDSLSFAGHSFKVWMVIFQLIGYMLSKFIGIKIVSELNPSSRARGRRRAQCRLRGQNRTFVAGFLRNARHAERSNGRCSVLRHWAGTRSAASARDRRHDRGATRHNLRSGS